MPRRSRRGIAAIAYQNKALVYGLLFRATAETLRTIAADPKHLGAEIGFFAVLHTWGKIYCTIPTCTASYRVAGFRRTERDGSPASRASSCRSACSHACSPACSYAYLCDLFTRLANGHLAKDIDALGLCRAQSFTMSSSDTLR